MDTGYIEPKSEFLPSDTFEERLISLQMCNNVITDDILH